MKEFAEETKSLFCLLAGFSPLSTEQPLETVLSLFSLHSTVQGQAPVSDPLTYYSSPVLTLMWVSLIRVNK